MERFSRETIKNADRELTTGSKGLNLWQLSLLLPNEKVNVKIPGTGGKQSITVHKYMQRVDTLVGRDFVYHLSMNEVLDSGATNGSQFFTTNGYVAGNAPAANANCESMDFKTLFGLTGGTVTQGRVVSASVKVTSLSTTLNRTGTIYGALLRQAAPTNQAFGAGKTATLPSVPSIIGTNPKCATVADGQGIQVNYLPSDEDDFAFLAPNAMSSTRHPQSDDVMTIVIIGQGLENNSTIKFEVFINFEVIPTPNASLAGLENYGSQPPSIPLIDLEHVSKYHIKDMVKIVYANEGFISDSYSNFAERIMKRKPNNKLRQPINIPISNNGARGEPENRNKPQGQRYVQINKGSVAAQLANLASIVGQIALTTPKTLPGTGLILPKNAYAGRGKMIPSLGKRRLTARKK